MLLIQISPNTIVNFEQVAAVRWQEVEGERLLVLTVAGLGDGEIVIKTPAASQILWDTLVSRCAQLHVAPRREGLFPFILNDAADFNPPPPDPSSA